MARKTLLNEAEIRRFMKLANMAPVATERMDEMYPPGARDEELEAEAGVEMDTPEGDVAVEDEVALDEPMADEAPMEEPVDDMGMDAAGAMVSVDDFMAALETALEEVTGEEVSTEVDLEAGEEEAEDLEGGDVALDGPEAEPMPDMEVGAEEEEVEFSMQEQLVNKVAQRVAARLVKQNRKAKLTEELTERIFNRLTQK
tara:strand:- start:2301 stop:2900 length:600 start_codon:yes stop_codon:yes gene_type:complete